MSNISWEVSQKSKNVNATQGEKQKKTNATQQENNIFDFFEHPLDGNVIFDENRSKIEAKEGRVFKLVWGDGKENGGRLIDFQVNHWCFRPGIPKCVEKPERKRHSGFRWWSREQFFPKPGK